MEISSIWSPSFLGYLTKRMIACFYLEIFNFANLHLPFFIRFLGVIACCTRSDWLSPSLLSLPLSVAKCFCRFFLNILPADSFFYFPFDDLGCLSTEPVIKNFIYSKLYRQLDIEQITKQPFLGKYIEIFEKIDKSMAILLKTYIQCFRKITDHLKYHLNQLNAHHYAFQRRLMYFFVCIEWQVGHIHLLQLMSLQG